MNTQEILSRLPYSKPFIFVDDIIQIDENGVVGTYFFDETQDFYKGHFKDKPVTPGVILTEVMAQIGLVCLGIYLLKDTLNPKTLFALTSMEMEFIKPVFPNEEVRVISEKIYFRFGKLKCKVIMRDKNGDDLCRGTIAGMINMN